jgi:tetratricopeptide (TPR) repeat protein
VDWFLDQWSKHPAATATIVAAVIAGVIGIGVAVVNAWATLRAGKRNGDPAPTNQNNQTGQQGGQGVQAHTIHGGVHHNDGSSFDANQLARDYADASRRLGALEAENEQFREQVNQGDEQTEAAVAQAVADLALEAARAEDPYPFDSALAELREGRPDAAETLFLEIKDERRAAGKAALKHAARAARHIGALAFYHDTRKSLEAYQEAVALDGADAEGWNELGHLRMRLGELDGAKMAYEKGLSLSNQSSDKGVIAVATGDRGLIY